MKELTLLQYLSPGVGRRDALDARPAFLAALTSRVWPYSARFKTASLVQSAYRARKRRMPQPGSIRVVDADLSPARAQVGSQSFVGHQPVTHLDHRLAGWNTLGVLKSLLAQQEQEQLRSKGLAPPNGCITFSWSVIVESSALNMGMLFVGVCDLKATHAWGLCPFDGKLHRLSRDARTGAVNYLTPPPRCEPQPDGTPGLAFPDGQGTPVLCSATSRPGKPATWSSLGCCDGTVIECMVDCDGLLSFKIDGLGPYLVPNFAFPSDTPLRKWCFVPGEGDLVYEIPAQNMA